MQKGYLLRRYVICLDVINRSIKWEVIKMNKKDTLYFFTAEFPYGQYGESFIENEIPVLAAHFKKIILFPFSAKGSTKKPLPENVTVDHILNNRQTLRPKNIFNSYFFYIISTLFSEFLKCPNKRFFIQRIKHYTMLLIKGIYDAEQLLKVIPKENYSIVFYSFWMNDWALSLAILKSRREINNFFFRCGGFDLYDERHEGNYLPFRYFIYKNATGIFPVSKMGEQYIRKKNMFLDKVETRYLGTNDHGMNPFDSTACFTILSCSNLISLKRVHLIIEILKNIDFKLNWVHFGGGALNEELKKLATDSLPANINFIFKGSVSNKEVNAFYKSTSINLFITTSETEGLPVSIQEAISFGIPVIATRVGGIPEIVTEQTGFLIDKEFNVHEVAKLIKNFKDSEQNTAEYRKVVRIFWENNFSAERNYSTFCNRIIME